jgi:hypothetical protein
MQLKRTQEELCELKKDVKEKDNRLQHLSEEVAQTEGLKDQLEANADIMMNNEEVVSKDHDTAREKTQGRS